eukprot:3670911-Amphidinium_carterae.1
MGVKGKLHEPKANARALLSSGMRAAFLKCFFSLVKLSHEVYAKCLLVWRCYCHPKRAHLLVASANTCHGAS